LELAGGVSRAGWRPRLLPVQQVGGAIRLICWVRNVLFNMQDHFAVFAVAINQENT
jgi:hypothetical protein